MIDSVRGRPPTDSPRTALVDAVLAELRDLRRGGLRLALGLFWLWFVFWSFAYVFQPYSSLKPEPAFATRVTEWRVVVPCVIAALVLGSWVALGFSPAPDRPDGPASLTRVRLRVRLSAMFASQTPVGRTKP